MKLWQLVIKEIFYRKANFGLALLAITGAIGCLAGVITLLKIHTFRTTHILELKQAETKKRLAKLEDEMRKAMLKLGFNIVILPKSQKLSDWYANDYGSEYMPEEYADKLVQSKIITIRHLLPCLYQKIKWPETKRTIILVGTKGEVDLTKKPLVERVTPGEMVVGYELYQSLGLKIGDKVKLLGRTFTLTRCHPEQGNKDDVTIWISLRDAQELLNKRGLINAILAIECRCAWADLAKVRAEITALLPNTQVIERASRALARAEARLKVAEEAKAALEQEKQNRANLRRERERFGAILILLVIIVTILWLSYLAFTNVQERKPEIGILRAIGFRSHQIILLFIIKALLIGITGGLLGTLVGISIGKHLGLTLEQETLPLGVLFEPKLFLLGIGVAVVLSSIASWLPALSAAQQEPAVILRRE